MILQKILINVKSPLDTAEKYFAIISVVNNLDLAKREIQLIAFTAVMGDVYSNRLRKEFVKEYGSSLATVGNIISKFSKNGLLVKGKKSVNVNKALLDDFNNGIRMDITLQNVKPK